MTAATTERTWDFGRLGPDVPEGPWTGEPDKVQWVDPDTDLDCLILRNHGGALCGYVGIPEHHPWFGKGYSECLQGCDEEFSCYEHSPDATVQVHGGLTFAASCSDKQGDDAICHVPFPGRSDKVWWLGFDCAHSGDVSPSYAHRFPRFGDETYKTLDYVKAEVASLAQQLAAVPA